MGSDRSHMEITALSPDLLSGILKHNAISLTPVYWTVMCIILSPNSCGKVRFPQGLCCTCNILIFVALT